MKTFKVRTLLPAACALLVAGCQTPQPVLDQANNTAALTGSLDAELRAFKEVRTTIAKGRIESIKRQENAMAQVAREDAYTDRTRELAGQSEFFALMDTLRKLADSRREDDEALAKRIAETQKALADTTAPLRVPSEKLSATQKSLSVLGEELSRSEWVKFVVGFAKEVRKGMKDAKDSAAASVDKGAKEVQPQRAPKKTD